MNLDFSRDIGNSNFAGQVTLRPLLAWVAAKNAKETVAAQLSKGVEGCTQKANNVHGQHECSIETSEIDVYWVYGMLVDFW